MSFLEDIEKIEQDKRQLQQEIRNRMPAWVHAVNQLWRFIENHLYRPGQVGRESLIQVHADENHRVDNFQLGRLTITYDGKKVGVTPLSLTDPQVRGAAGCVVLQSDGVAFDLRWDGSSSHGVGGHWAIIQTAGGSKAKANEQPLTSDTFDDALRRLFGLIIEI